MADGVVEQVGDDPAQLLTVADTCAADTWRVSTADPGTLERPDLLEHDVVEVDRPPGALGSAGVAAGEHEEVVGQPLQSVDLLEQAGQHLGRRALALGDLELGAHAGERRAQLVRGVGDEPLLLPARDVEPVEHLVHRRRQAGDLVPAGRLRHPAVELAQADAGDLGPDPLDRAQRAPDEHPDQRRRGSR